MNSEKNNFENVVKYYDVENGNKIGKKELKRRNKISNIIFYCFYLIVALTSVMAFHMYRLDKYEFYIKNKEVMINRGSTYQVELIPKYIMNFDYLNYKYEVENEEIAKVDEFGEVTALGSGETELKIRYRNGFTSKKMKIVTQDIEIKKVDIQVENEENKEEINLVKGESIKVVSVANGIENLNISGKYESDNPDVVEIDQFGNVNAVGEGIATIKVTTDNEVTGEIIINVEKEEKEVESIELEENSINIKKGSKASIVTRINPIDATNQNLVFESDNDNVSVDAKGIVTGKRIGSSVIIVRSGNGKMAFCTVNVEDTTIEIEAIDIEPSVNEIKIGESYQIIATISPNNATEREITWTSSNSNVATVSNGKVTGKSAGTAIITATGTNGKKAISEVEVKDNKIEVNSIKMTENNISLEVGSKTQLVAEISPNDVTEKKLTWTSSNSNIATVDSNGKVTGKSVGTATITVTSSNGKSASTKVAVTEDKIEVKTISLSPTKKEMNVKEEFQLVATISPNNATEREITWTSSNSNVATVSNGKVTAKNAGEATITATVNGKKATAKITVKVPVTKVTLSGSTSVKVNGTITLTATISPNNATEREITWTSSNSNVATVSNGKVTGKSVGTVKITAKASNGKSASKTITVKANEVLANSVKVNPTSLKIKVGDIANLSAVMSPSGVTNTSITWTSNNTNVATVSNGKVMGKSAGTATITAKTSNGKKATATITVENNTVEVTGIKLNIESTSKYVGETITLKAIVSPSNATNKNVTFKSNKENIATVDSNGKVTAKGVGTVTITATVGGQSASAVITVKNKTVNATSIELNMTSSTIIVGKTTQLTATIKPSNAANKAVRWTSSDSNIATVSNIGLVKGIKAGTVTITAKTSNGKKATSKIIVDNNYSILIIGNSKTFWINGYYSRTSLGIANRFIDMSKEAGYLKQDSSQLNKKENLSYAYIGSTGEVTIVEKNGDGLPGIVTATPHNEYIKNKEYNIVIIQGNFYDYVGHESNYSGVETIVKSLKNFNGTIYYRTCYPKKWPGNDVGFDNSLNKMNKNAEKIVENIKKDYGIDIQIIHDGNAFKEARSSGIEIYFDDDNHQNENGAYLAALCTYVRVFNADATKINNNQFAESNDVANKLKVIANSTCKKY